MLKSVWLKNVLLQSFGDASSPISVHFQFLNGLFHAKECILRLYEPDGEQSTDFLLSKVSACVLPQTSDKPNGETVKKAMRERQSVLKGDALYCPLFFENVASFGALVFFGVQEKVQWEKIKDATLSFGTVLYAESMGSILRSYHPTILRAENVCVDYRHGKQMHRVVKNVNLEIYEKEFSIIEGASGCGKTSLLNALGGMLTPADGNVLWKGKNVAKMNEKERTAYRRNDVGFIFQRYNLIPELTAEENVNVAASLAKDPLSAEEALDMVGLKGKKRSYPSQLSGGEQQRVCIARALVKKAQLLLCDEPTGALDSENAHQIVKILKSLTKEREIPVVVITHNPSLVVLADHSFTMSSGTIVSDVLQPFALPAEELILR